QRYERLLELGLVDPEWGLPPPDERSAASYDNLGEHATEAMAVYAAMVDRMDQSIGRVLDKIRELGKEDNTLVLFFSDNGGCAEEIHNTPHLPPGGIDSYQTVGAAWANASNTPFRLFKDFDHEGGIATPLIASWPAVMQGGQVVHSVGHVMDLLPTFAELAGIELPAKFGDRDLLPLEGQSLAPVFREEEVAADERKLYWMIGGAKAMRKGKWKIVTQGPERTQAGIAIPAGHDAWELYDMQADRCELHDLADQYPQRVVSMAESWNAWYARCLADTGAQRG
ncbi:MAG: sulfatase-like hydrolase/transferase, partial [Pseudomonadota bacterium]